jgi:hypothetical protein
MMMNRRLRALERLEAIGLIVLAVAATSAAETEGREMKMAIGPVDSMPKVFQGRQSPENRVGAIVIQAARNETASGQAVGCGGSRSET